MLGTKNKDSGIELFVVGVKRRRRI